jgi:hypothetical protein
VVILSERSESIGDSDPVGKNLSSPSGEDGAKVNILALLGTAQDTAGTVQLAVDDARRAKKALDAARIAYQETLAESYDLPTNPVRWRNAWKNS